MSAAAPTKKEETGIGWNSHKPVTEVPESLVRGVEGNESMRRRFEKACREAQVGREEGREGGRGKPYVAAMGGYMHVRGQTTHEGQYTDTSDHQSIHLPRAILYSSTLHPRGLYL